MAWTGDDRYGGSNILGGAETEGSYKVENSGISDITYTDVAGDLYIYNKNGDVELTLPEDLNFKFEAITKNGSVSSPFESALSVKNDTVMGNVGDRPGIMIKTETRNGNIKAGIS